MDRRNRLGLLGALALAVAAACGEGRAIFNVDVLSFMQSAKRDTLAYGFPLAGSGSVNGVPAKVGLVGGLGANSADSVSFTVGAAVENHKGSMSMRFLLLFAKDSAGTYTSTDTTGTGTVAVANLQTGSLSLSKTIVGDTVFNNADVWILMRAIGTVTVAPDSGTLRLNQFTVRLVLKDKPF
jgi:hypothetical protein